MAMRMGQDGKAGGRRRTGESMMADVNKDSLSARSGEREGPSAKRWEGEVSLGNCNPPYPLALLATLSPLKGGEGLSEQNPLDRPKAAGHIAGAMSATPFLKMHGLGNDFVVIDARKHALALDEDRARRIADRRTGVGCDQLIAIEPPTNRLADAFMRVHNADGGVVETCGNGLRCIADLLMK